MVNSKIMAYISMEPSHNMLLILLKMINSTINWINSVENNKINKCDGSNKKCVRK